MNKIYRIARTELSILFYSPIAWLLLVIFMVQAGFAFAELLAEKEAAQQLYDQRLSLTQTIFGGNKGFFAAMQKYLYLYVPLLTMGLLSREIGSGSIKLLQSSPVTVFQIVMGKYLAILTYCLLLIAVLTVFVGIGAFAIEHIDVGFICSALFGLFLLLAAYSAIGLFLSSLTGYQVVAAISTLAVLGALSYVGDVGNNIEVVRDITYWFAMDRHTGYALRGLLSSKDITYFLLIILLFLALTVMRLNSGRIVRSTAIQIGRYVLLVAAVIVIGYITSLPKWSWYKDVTRFETQSYTPHSVNIVNQIEGPVTLTSYVNVLGGYANIGAPRFRNLERSSLEHMERYLPQMKMKHVTYYDTASTIRIDPNIPVEDQAMRRALTWGYDVTKIWAPDSLRKEIDLYPEQGMLVRMLSVNGKSTPLRMFFDMVAYPQEKEVIAALTRLLGKPLRVGMMEGQDERGLSTENDKDYGVFLTQRTSRDAWINLGADLVTLRPESDKLNVDSIDLLIIADPYEPYTSAQLAHIRQYIADGGNLLLTGEPHKQSILNPIAASFGVQFDEGTLLQESKELEADLIQARFVPDLQETGFSGEADKVVTLLGACGLSYQDTGAFRIRPILETDERYVWNKLGRFDLNAEKVVFHPGVDRKIKQPVAVAVTRQLADREQRIFVAGDADIFSKGELGRYNVTNRNFQLTSQLLHWYSYGTYPPDTERPEPIDHRLRINKSNVDAIRIVTVFVVPFLLALWGALIIIRRKRK